MTILVRWQWKVQQDVRRRARAVGQHARLALKLAGERCCAASSLTARLQDPASTTAGSPPHEGVHRMVAQPDAERTQTLVRFGWACAELRGRHRQQVTGLPVPAQPRPTRTERTLPLNNERSPGELAHQVAADVGTLAKLLALDFPLSALPFQSQEATGTATERLQTLCDALNDAEGEAADARNKAWDRLGRFFYAWDTKIQDTLASSRSPDAIAYQTGRALAEAYWSLSPAAGDDDVRSWTSLLGPYRCATIKLFLVELSPCFGEPTIAAVVASVEAWRRIAAAKADRNRPEAPQRLAEQVSVWRMLLVDRVDPHSFVDPKSAAAQAGHIGALVKTFWVEMLIASMAVILVVLAIGVLSTNKNSGVAVAVPVVLGVFGITGAGVLAAAKAGANAAFAKLRQALDAEILADAVTIVPAKARERA